MKHPILTVGAIALFALTAVLAHVHATPPQYSVIVLDSLGGTSSEANGINASGQVAGSSFTTGNSHYDAVRWTGIAATNLGNLGGKDAYGLGINASGQVAGYSYLPGSSVLHAVRWTETIATDLGTLGGTHSNGFGINTSGQVAGTSQIGNAATHAARWTGTTPTDLGTLGGTDSYGYGINDSGQVTGRAQTGSGVFHAVRWTDTTPTDLGTLGGDSSGSAINLVGQVAGYYYLAGNSGPAHAVRWTGTTPTDLGTLGGSTSYALGINASGDIIGDSYTADDASFVGFLYIGGKMYDLNTLLVPGSGVTGITVPQAFTGVGANSINDYGQIAAQGTVGGRTRALLLSPVPVVMLAGANPMTLEGGTAYVDPGATASDLKDGMLTPSITSNTVESDVLGTYAVTWSATNSAGGTGRATRVVNVVDTTKPTLTVPTNIIVEATGASGATVSFSVSANDTVSGELTLSVEPASGSTFALGATTVNASVTDASGNMATGSFTVTVKDTTAPVVTVPTNITTEAAGPSGAVVSFTVSASDLVDGARATTLDHASESTFPIGTTTVNVTAQDTHGNIGSTSFTVTVRDTTAPVINPHPDVYALAPGLDGVVVNYDAATATEGVSTPTFSYSQDSGTVFPVGTTTVTVNAVDAAHNHAISTHFDVIVHLAGAVSEKRLAQGDDAPGAGTNGLPADAKLASFGTPATDDAGDLAFLAKWTGTMGGKAAKGGGLFLNDQCLAVVGGDASAIGGPGATWKSFTDPVVDAGHLVCIATLSGVPKSSASAVVCNLTSPALEKIARAGGEATDDGAKFKSFKAVEIVGTRLAWFAQLAPGTGTSPRTSAANDYGIWMHDANGARLMMRERQPLLDKTIKTLVSFVPGNGSPGQGRGWFVDAGGAVGSAVFARAKFTDQSQGVILETGLHFPDLRPLSIGGGGPGSPDLLATYFTSYGLPARNSRGTTLFRATLSTRLGGATKADARGIFFNTSLLGPYTPLVRTDDDAVSGAKFNAFKDPVLAEDGAIAFAATIKGGTVKGLGSTTLWWRRPGGQLTPLAQAGPLAAGEPNDLPAGAEWKTFPSLALAANRGPIFAATLIPHKGGVTPATASGVWAMDFDGKLRTLFRTGDQIDVGAPGTPVLKKVKSFKLLMATVGSTGVTRSFNDDAQVVWLATFVDKTTALVMTEVP